MSDPNERLTWATLEAYLVQIYRLPHNEVLRQERARAGKGYRPAVEQAKAKVREIQEGSIGEPERIELVGPRRVLRAAGERNRVFEGEWWFEEKLFTRLDSSYSRIATDEDRKAVLVNLLREALAVSTEWNSFEELWVMEIPVGQKITALTSLVKPQKLFANLELNEKANRMLVGHARQFYFPVKNPFWIRLYMQLH